MKKTGSLLFLAIGIVLGGVAVYFFVTLVNADDADKAAKISGGVIATLTALGAFIKSITDLFSGGKADPKNENLPVARLDGDQSGAFNQRISGNISNATINQQMGDSVRKRQAVRKPVKPKGSKQPKSKLEASKPGKTKKSK